MSDYARSDFDSLLLRKRGDYGPLGLFELATATWAIVWQECLEDDETCRLILSEDPGWFNREWGKDGRRPNPTYKTQSEALVEVIRSLSAIAVDLGQGDARRDLYDVYIANAKQDLMTPLTDWTMSASYPHGADDMDLDSEPFRHVGPFPWDNAAGEPKGLSLKMAPTLYAKMVWCTENIPKMSLQKIARMGAEKMADELIAKHYRPEGLDA